MSASKGFDRSRKSRAMKNDRFIWKILNSTKLTLTFGSFNQLIRQNVLSIVEIVAQEGRYRAYSCHENVPAPFDLEESGKILLENRSQFMHNSI